MNRLLRRLRGDKKGVSAVEFALEGLFLNRRIAKDAVPGRTVYGGS